MQGMVYSKCTSTRIVENYRISILTIISNDNLEAVQKARIIKEKKLKFCSLAVPFEDDRLPLRYTRQTNWSYHHGKPHTFQASKT